MRHGALAWGLRLLLLHVSEGQQLALSAANGIISANGQALKIKGVNYWGLEGELAVLGGLRFRPLDDILDLLADEGFNAIRVPLAVQHILTNPLPNQYEIHGGRNADLKNISYLELLDAVVARAAPRGLLILLDMHRLAPGAASHHEGAGGHDDTPLWYNLLVPEAQVAEAWRVLATRYCGAWNILGGDVYNEPFASSWGSSGNWGWGSPAATDFKRGATLLAGEILGICPRWLIIVSGVRAARGTTEAGGRL